MIHVRALPCSHCGVVGVCCIEGMGLRANQQIRINLNQQTIVLAACDITYIFVNWSNVRCPLKSIPLYPSPSLQIYPSLAFDRYSSLNICPSISLPQDISGDIEAHNLSQEQSVPSTHWLPFPPTRSAARLNSDRLSWRAGVSVRRWGRAYRVISHRHSTNPWSCYTMKCLPTALWVLL